MPRMLSSPTSLLNVSLWRSDFDTAHRIIDFFHLGHTHSAEAMLGNYRNSELSHDWNVCYDQILHLRAITCHVFSMVMAGLILDKLG